MRIENPHTTRTIAVETFFGIAALLFVSTLMVCISTVDGNAQRIPSRGQTMMQRAPITPPPLSATERIVVEIRKAAYRDRLRNLSQLGIGPQWPANPVLQRPPRGLEQPAVPAVVQQGTGRPPTGLRLPGIRSVPQTGMGRPPTGLALPGIRRVPQTGTGRPPTGLALPGVRRVPQTGPGNPATRPDSSSHIRSMHRTGVGVSPTGAELDGVPGRRPQRNTRPPAGLRQPVVPASQ